MAWLGYTVAIDQIDPTKTGIIINMRVINSCLSAPTSRLHPCLSALPPCLSVPNSWPHPQLSAPPPPPRHGRTLVFQSPTLGCTHTYIFHSPSSPIRTEHGFNIQNILYKKPHPSSRPNAAGGSEVAWACLQEPSRAWDTSHDHHAHFSQLWRSSTST